MKVAILETIAMESGHEVGFDKIIVDALKEQNHTPIFWVPSHFQFKMDYGAPIEYLNGGKAVSYTGLRGMRKLIASIQREYRRMRWFNDAYKKAIEGQCDAIIVPTSTYRYMRTLLKSQLKHSPVPVHFIFHGINPGEREKFTRYAKQCEPYKNIYCKVLTLRDDVDSWGLDQVKTVYPPVFLPVEPMAHRGKADGKKSLHIGLFGQFRKEKRVDILIDAFERSSFPCPVELTVQGATQREDDERVFAQLIERYGNNEAMHFIHKPLVGREWDEALLGVDGILLPYGAERYRYHWSAMLFTALGFKKPVLISEEINPEVLSQFHVGEVIQSMDVETVQKALETFVTCLYEEPEVYKNALDRANEVYGHDRFIVDMLKL